ARREEPVREAERRNRDRGRPALKIPIPAAGGSRGSGRMTATAPLSVVAAAVVAAAAGATAVVVAAAGAGVAAVVVAALVVPVVVVLVADAVVVLERLDRAAQIGLDGGPVGRIARVERSAVLYEPLAGVDVEGDVRGLVGDDEAALELLLGLDRADEGEWLAVEGALDDRRSVLLQEVARARCAGGALERMHLELDLVVGARGNRRVEDLVHAAVEVRAGQVDDHRADRDLGAAVPGAAAQLDLLQGHADAGQRDPRGRCRRLRIGRRVARAEREGCSGASAASGEQQDGEDRTAGHAGTSRGLG